MKMWPPHWPPQTAAARNDPAIKFINNITITIIGLIDVQCQFIPYPDRRRQLIMAIRAKRSSRDMQMKSRGGYVIVRW